MEPRNHRGIFTCDGAGNGKAGARHRLKSALIAVLALAMLWCSCGRKGPVIIPEALPVEQEAEAAAQQEEGEPAEAVLEDGAEEGESGDSEDNGEDASQ